MVKLVRAVRYIFYCCMVFVYTVQKATAANSWRRLVLYMVRHVLTANIDMIPS